jgi:hypothetical protein
LTLSKRCRCTLAFRASNYLEGHRIFWDVANPANAVVVDLDDETFNQLVIEVQDPDQAVALLTAAV